MTATARTRRARGSLSATEILDGTYDLVLRDGLDKLSMPALGRHLGAGVTSIYWYFRNKDELLLALAERVAVDLFDRLPTLDGGSGIDPLERQFVALREELLTIPAFLEVLTLRPRELLNRPAVAPLIAARVEEELALFLERGLEPQEAIRLYTACWSYTHGFVLLEVGRHHESDDIDDATGDEATFGEAADFPILDALGGVDPILELDDEQFLSGLRFLLDGIRAELRMDR